MLKRSNAKRKQIDERARALAAATAVRASPVACYEPPRFDGLLRLPLAPIGDDARLPRARVVLPEDEDAWLFARAPTDGEASARADESCSAPYRFPPPPRALVESADRAYYELRARAALLERQFGEGARPRSTPPPACARSVAEPALQSAAKPTIADGALGRAAPPAIRAPAAAALVGPCAPSGDGRAAVGERILIDCSSSPDPSPTASPQRAVARATAPPLDARARAHAAAGGVRERAACARDAQGARAAPPRPSAPPVPPRLTPWALAAGARAANAAPRAQAAAARAPCAAGGAGRSAQQRNVAPMAAERWLPAQQRSALACPSFLGAPMAAAHSHAAAARAPPAASAAVRCAEAATASCPVCGAQAPRGACGDWLERHQSECFALGVGGLDDFFAVDF
ncbi:hypothetical protein KFE25_001374 [Diacronema lutheri]|uniref:Uncharacterized protein n=1 Tax=Diacronema lutheri TaxID=2081491 RepID=A0A8J5X5W2_DIALT|nr:hypothetical protein KFE25_001374 [Diacronema lutheri]